MNKLIPRLTIVMCFLSLFAIGYTVYTLYQLPGHLTQSLRLTDMKQMENLQKALLPLSLIIGITLLISFLATSFCLLAYQQQVLINTRVYREETTEEIKMRQEEQNTNIQQNTQRLQNFKKAINQEAYQSTEMKWEKILTGICREIEASQGAYYEATREDDKTILEFRAGYAFYLPESKPIRYELGEGLIGQAAKEGKLVNIAAVPEGYLTVLSGLGKAEPSQLVLVPVKTEGQLSGMMEIASFQTITPADEAFLQSAASLVGS
jgi:putative methionine-R-sulfoxide reductase with GAF domain